ncbi:MAG: peptide deformylase [Rhodoferax sp.]|jgi:peptide deformylase|nr:peptide deformylase [Rhodoferax sp.]
MTVRDILKMGDLRLLRLAQPVTQFDSDALHLLITDLLDTMRAADGAGLAAPQIGVDLQVVIFGSNTPSPRYPGAPLVPRTVLINPRIEALPPVAIEPARSRASGQVPWPVPDQPAEVEDWEGCLSVPGLRGKVPRFARIRYTGFDQFGDAIERVAEGFHARVVQHECDHLIGKLYPMRVRDFGQFGFTSVLFPGLDASDD